MFYLPKLLSFITRHPRYLPEIEWADNLWTHNIFRVYELIFWRREGIRAGSGTWSYYESGRKVVRTEIYSFEDLCAHVEVAIRNFFKIPWLQIKVESFQFALPGAVGSSMGQFGSRIPMISFAIALDAVTNNTDNNSSPSSFAKVCTGSARILLYGSSTNSGTSSLVTTDSATYNSVSLTKVRADSNTTTRASESSIWMLHAPTLGSNTVSVVFSGGFSPKNSVGAISYTGAQQSSTADAHNGANGTGTGNKTVSVTVVASGCWMFANMAADTFSLTMDQTSRWNVTNGFGKAGGEDTNGTVGTGSQTMGFSLVTTGTSYGMSACSFAPYSGDTLVEITQTANPAGVAASSTVATYSSVDIGAEDSSRIIAVVVGTELADSTPSACTIDSGGGAVAMTAGTTGNFGAVYARVFYLAVPTGTSATIAVTFSAVSPGNTANHIAVYRVVGASATLSAEGGYGSSDMDATDPLTTGSVTIPTNGAFLGIAAGATDTGAKTWANAGAYLDVDAGTFRFTTATSDIEGSVTITCTGVTNGEDGALSWVIFSPAAAGGSLVKTVNGLAIASVKTVNGLAIASVKTVNGLSNV